MHLRAFGGVQQGENDKDTQYAQIGADQWLGSRYSISASARSYFGGSLESLELMARAGMSF